MAERTATVAMGDTLWALARRNLGAGHRWPEIYARNRDVIRDPNVIRVGQTIRIPDRDRYGASDPHPLQRSRPRIAALTATAASPTSVLPFPSAPGGANLTRSNPLSSTTVNLPAIKFDLGRVPPVISPIPGGFVKISWTGQATVWKDGQQPLSSLTTKGGEITDKRVMAGVLGDLLESRKLTVGADKTVTYEDLMSFVSYGSPGTVVSSGIVSTLTNPIPVYRTQIKRRLMQGKLRDYLFVANDMTINFDIEIARNPPGGGQAPALQTARVGAPYPGRVLSDPVAPRKSALQGIGAWTLEHKQAIIVTVEIGALVALAFLTLGGSVVAEGAAAGVVLMGARAVGSPAT